MPIFESKDGSTVQYEMSVPTNGASLGSEPPTGIGAVAFNEVPITSPDDMISAASERVTLARGKDLITRLSTGFDSSTPYRKLPPSESFPTMLAEAKALADVGTQIDGAKTVLAREVELLDKTIESTDTILRAGATHYPEAVEQVSTWSDKLGDQLLPLDPKTPVFTRVADGLRTVTSVRRNLERLPGTVEGFKDAVRAEHPDFRFPAPRFDHPEDPEERGSIYSYPVTFVRGEHAWGIRVGSGKGESSRVVNSRGGTSLLGFFVDHGGQGEVIPATAVQEFLDQEGFRTPATGAIGNLKNQLYDSNPKYPIIKTSRNSDIGPGNYALNIEGRGIVVVNSVREIPAARVIFETSGDTGAKRTQARNH